MSQVVVPERRIIDDVEIVLLGSLSIIGFVLNTALFSRLLTASKQPTVRTSFSAGPYQLNSFALFKLNLCIADFMILTIYALGKIIWLVTYAWRFGDTSCKLYKFLSTMCFYASSNIIVNIALDRLKQVYNKRPQGATSVRRVRIMLITSWTLAVLCSIPQLFVWKTHKVNDDWEQCVSIFNGMGNDTTMNNIALLYEISHLASVFWIPFAVTFVSYIVIVVRLLVKHHLPVRKNIVRLGRPSESESRTDTSLLGRIKDTQLKKISIINPSQKVSDTKRKKEIQREYNAAAWRAQLRSRVFRSATAIVICHLAMWLPYNCISILRFVKYDWYELLDEGFSALLMDLIVVNSLLNPLIYGQQRPTRARF